ncbi:hypothetical protein HMPREF1983_01563 [Gemella bergeri ATCC 700627]|uniref:6-phosphogluconolactonase n=1 Tax=Gemella bergeri ATCC 700627 TaxID=1321820 RepID=U2QHS8_9BACL|nr:lactonase family protein [Gemella bergeri]ERK56026.1 hypothetical protein HMPREF1983_01563 [Gemella bergeri ATCC 700627]
MPKAYIGTYTKKESQGIYKVELDLQGKVKNIESAAKIENPTYLDFSTDKQYLYSVSKKDKNGAVTSFKILPDGILEELTAVEKEGNPPCYVEISRDNKYLLSANYHTGTIDSYSVVDGKLSSLLSTDIHFGSSIHPRQEKPHVHFSGFTPDNKYVFSCDLGTDEITTYTLEHGILSKRYTTYVKNGSGPRHIIFDNTLTHAFVITELTSEVIVFDYDDGKLSNPTYYATLPANFFKENKGSAIKISNNNRFIYVSNRGQDSIVVFRNNNGSLTHIQTISTYGQNPRDFNLSEDNHLAIATNETSGTITTYTVNTITGKLTAVDKEFPVPEAVCVKFY